MEAINPTFTLWTAELQVEPNAESFCGPVTIQPVTCEGFGLGTARNFRFFEGRFFATLLTIAEEWTRLVGDPDEPKAAYAGPFKILGAAT